MAPIKNKRCCVPYCPNAKGNNNKKQFFRMGANLPSRYKFLRVGKLVNPTSTILHCCEDHFDLPNDALNYIRYKYQPGTKLKLRPNVMPNKKLPVNVCRICLNLIYNEDDLVDISPENAPTRANIVTTLLPSIDLSVTIDPVACLKCFNPLKQTYAIKQNLLSNEMVVVTCLNSVIRKSSKKYPNVYQIDLFDEYNEIQDLKQQTPKENDNTDSSENEDQLRENEAQLGKNEDELKEDGERLMENMNQLKEDEL